MNFDVPAALDYAEQGRLEDWIHAYLTGGPWANLGLSDGLKLQRRWWRGPLELPLEKLTRSVPSGSVTPSAMATTAWVPINSWDGRRPGR